jgi:hypothetical protein
MARVKDWQIFFKTFYEKYYSKSEKASCRFALHYKDPSKINEPPERNSRKKHQDRNGLNLKSDVFKHVYLIKSHPRASGDRRKRVIRNGNRQSGFFPDQNINIGQQRSAAGQDNTAVNNIAGQFRG